MTSRPRTEVAQVRHRPDEEVGIGDNFNKANPHYGQKGLGTATWEGDAWKIGGGTNWGWYAYDPDENLVYYGSGNPSPWNETMRPGDNKWTMTIMGRDADTGELRFGYQKTHTTSGTMPASTS